MNFLRGLAEDFTALKEIFTASPNAEEIKNKVFIEELAKKLGIEKDNIVTYQIMVGGKTAEEYLAELESQPDKCIKGSAKDIMIGLGKNVFENGRLKKAQLIQLVCLTVKDLGFPDGASTNGVYVRALKLGLEFCLPDVGPALCLQVNDLKQLIIVLESLYTRYDLPNSFSLGAEDGKLRLGAYFVHPTDCWAPDSEFIFQQVNI